MKTLIIAFSLGCIFVDAYLAHLGRPPGPAFYACLCALWGLNIGIRLHV